MRHATSYHQSLVALNARIAREGKPPVRLLPDAVQDEDMLDMVNAGLLDAVVADDWPVDIWKPMLPALTVNRDAVVHGGGHIGWAIRKHSPRLAADIADCLQDARFSEADRTLFAFASYHAGPGNMRRMRAEAQRRGLDPDQWFNHVETVTAEKLGVETTTCVRNIYKYDVAYKLTAQIRLAQDKARELAVHVGQ